MINGRRVAIVAGVRTPFAKSGTIFRDTPAVSLARHAARELLYRTEIDGREIDEVIFSQVVASVLTPNVAREVSLLAAAPAERAGVHDQPGLRLLRPGHPQRRRPDHSRPCRRRPRRRGRVAFGHPDPALPPVQPDPGRRQQGQERRRARRHLRADPSQGPRPGDARDRGTVHRRDHGPVGGEDGQGERHPARGPGSLRADESPARGGRHVRRPARLGDRSLVRRRGDGRGGDQRQRHPRRTRRSTSSRSCGLSSTASTAR